MTENINKQSIEQLLFDTEVGTNKLTTQLKSKDTDFTEDDIIALRQCFEGSIVDSIFYDKNIVSNDRLKNLFYETEKMKAIQVNILNIYFKLLYEIKDDCYESNRNAKSTFNEWFKRKNEDVRANFDSLVKANLQDPNDRIEDIKKNIEAILTYNDKLENGKEKKLVEIRKEMAEISGKLTNKLIEHLDKKAEEQNEEMLKKIEASTEYQLSFLNKVLYSTIGAAIGGFLVLLITKI